MKSIKTLAAAEAQVASAEAGLTEAQAEYDRQQKLFTIGDVARRPRRGPGDGTLTQRTNRCAG